MSHVLFESCETHSNIAVLIDNLEVLLCVLNPQSVYRLYMDSLKMK